MRSWEAGDPQRSGRLPLRQAKVEGVDLTALQKRAAVHYQGLGQWRRAIRYTLRSRDLAFAAGVVENGEGMAAYLSWRKRNACAVLRIDGTCASALPRPSPNSARLGDLGGETG